MALVDQPDGFYHMPKITKEAHYFLAGVSLSLCGTVRYTGSAPLVPFRCATNGGPHTYTRASGPVCRECQKRNVARWSEAYPSPDKEATT